MIRFYCACGKRLKVDDALAGRPVQCPDCGAAARAPQADPEVLSGPEALVAAIKGTAGPAEDDIPVAEVVAGPADGVAADDSPPARAAAPEAAHLDALARAAAAAPAAR
ncbi:MAG: hypothetical protein IMZ66_12330, partial [Planctomycetes bacterium]|nr:hypothetical protein [Planctomycetota bacterium]